MNGTIFGNIAAMLYIAIFFCSALAIARRLFPGDCPVSRAGLGAAICLMLLMWLPALWSFLLGFTLLSQLLALLSAAVLGLFAWRKRPSTNPVRHISIKPFLICVFPTVLLMSYLLYTHTLYVDINGSLNSGQSTFGDMCMHLGIISSISRQGFFPPEYSILSGAPMSYPFLCDSISSTFYTLGASLKFSYMLPMALAFFSVASGVYIFFEGWFREERKAMLAFLLFFLGGGLGFAYFFDGSAANPANLARVFTGFYETPTNHVTQNIRWVNVIADMLIPQRATLFGWSLLFPCLHLLRRSSFDGEDYFIPLGILAGSLPLIHTHSFLALGLVSAVWYVRSALRRENLLHFTIYGLIACALAAPQLFLFTFRQAESFLKFNFNWANDGDFFLWFYIKNLGLIFLLLPAAFFSADKKDRMVWAGTALLWALAEFIQFQPNPYDNNKLLFIWFAFSCGLVASLLIDLYRKLDGMGGRRILACLAILSLTLSGAMTLGREWVSRYQLFSPDEAEAAAFIDSNLPVDALFLTAPNHNNAVAALSGRSIVCGSSSYLYYHGFDTSQREMDVRLMYQDPSGNSRLYDQYGVDYIFISSSERYYYDIADSEFYNQQLVFSNGSVQIYQYAGQ